MINRTPAPPNLHNLTHTTGNSSRVHDRQDLLHPCSVPDEQEDRPRQHPRRYICTGCLIWSPSEAGTNIAAARLRSNTIQRRHRLAQGPRPPEAT